MTKKLLAGLTAFLIGAMAVMANLTNIWSFIEQNFGDGGHGTEFVGRWKNTSHHVDQDGIATDFDGQSEYFQNGHFNSTGKMSLSWLDKDKKPNRIEYQLAWAGTWSVKGKKILTTAADVKSLATSLVTEGKARNPYEVATLLGSPIPSPAQLIASGTTYSATIAKIDHRHMELQQLDFHGSPFLVLGDRE
ncbi:hypothetical protein PCA31118_01649 [Pandoraea captiosa]|uniref:Uncharacterized protein n=1 Tax=Pandoraea captiosa TaxID=2508302 RepID=A0A5E4ZT48_9BURK|nr:hypothetical protein [Pandoraea captiosa]VVE64569.1 hypothetical protein PCA31118_01649 [Pandoraea captiosa]